MRLKIGDDFLDQDDSIIAQTYAVNDIGAINTRQGGFSNDFTLPLTARNKDILNYPNDINTGDRSAYQKVDACLYDGSTCVALGYIKYQIVTDGKTIQVSFFSDNVNWFYLVKTGSIQDIDLSEFDHVWSKENVKTAIDADKSSGYTYPYINYGRLDHGTSSVNQKLSNWYPGIFVNTLMNQIFEPLGFKLDGKMLNLNLYKRMFIPFSGQWVHSQEYIRENRITDTQNGTLNVVAARQDIVWTTAGGVNITWTPDNAYLRVTVCFSANGFPNGFTVFVIQNSSAFFEKTYPSPSGTQSYEISVEHRGSNLLGVPTSDTISVGVSDGFGGGGGTISLSEITIEALPEICYQGKVQMAATLPNIKKTDLLQYLSFIFGAVITTNQLSKTVTWSLYRDIKNNLSNALDWSDKLDMSQTKEVNFTELLQGYGQVSKLKYKRDEEDPDLESYYDENQKGIGQGQFNLNNEHLPGIVDYYEAPFGETWQSGDDTSDGSEDTAYIPKMKIWNDNATTPNDLERSRNITPRILVLSENIPVEDQIFSSLGTPITNISIGEVSASAVDIYNLPYAWFIKQGYVEVIDNLTDSMGFEAPTFPVIGFHLKERFLEDYEEVLNSMKYLKAYLRLTAVDIAALDFTVPIYLDHYKAYFYISKIENFQGRHRTTQVDLVKIA